MRPHSSGIAITAFAITSLVLIPTAEAQQEMIHAPDVSTGISYMSREGYVYEVLETICSLHKDGYVPTGTSRVILRQEIRMPELNKACLRVKKNVR